MFCSAVARGGRAAVSATRVLGLERRGSRLLSSGLEEAFTSEAREEGDYEYGNGR